MVSRFTTLSAAPKEAESTGIDVVPALPLALLVFLPLAYYVAGAYPGRPYAAIRYLAIPLAGFSAGASLFLFIVRSRSSRLAAKLASLQGIDGKRALFYAVLFHALFFAALSAFKYSSAHFAGYDFGIYDSKIWLISRSAFYDKFSHATSVHFQPVLLLYSSIYRIAAHPMVLQFSQAVAVASGAAPLFLLARKLLKTGYLAAGLSLFYLLYPAVEFNAAGDFHPDHLYIPLMLWAFYFIETGRYHLLPLVMLPALGLKEPLVPGVALTGLYMAIKNKGRFAGAAVFVFSIVVFFLTVYFFSGPDGVKGFNDPSFQHLRDGSLSAVFKEAFDLSKLRFPFFLLFPMLALPLLRPLEFMPALPAIAAALLSSSAHHQNVASHYTAGVVPYLFFALVHAFRMLEERTSERHVFGAGVWIFALIISFNVAHSPGPLSAAFWAKTWSGGGWHYSNYTETPHARIVAEAIRLVPEDPDISVVSHNKVYDKRLGHRRSFKVFPQGFPGADFILLDNERGPFLHDSPDMEGYRAAFLSLIASPDYIKVFEKHGVYVFMKRRRTLDKPVMAD